MRKKPFTVIYKKPPPVILTLEDGNEVEVTLCPPGTAQGAFTDRYTAKKKGKSRGTEYADSWRE